MEMDNDRDHTCTDPKFIDLDILQHLPNRPPDLQLIEELRERTVDKKIWPTAV